MENSERLALREFWRIAWPASMEGLIMVMLFAVNLLMVSSLGQDATSAVGIFAQPKMVLLCFARSFAIAVSAQIASCYGQGKIAALSPLLKQSFVVTTVGSLILVMVSLVYLQPILQSAGAKTGYMELALDYAQPAMAALFFTGLATILNAGLLGIGRTGLIMVTNVVGNLINLALTAALIFGWGPFPALGVAGAGYGTLVGAVVTFLLILAAVLDGRCLVTLRGWSGWKPVGADMKSLWRVFTGAFTEQGVERVGMFVYSRMAAELGTLSFAVHTICMNLCDLYYSFAQGMGKASLVFAGRSLGAGDKQSFAATAYAGQRIGLAVSAVAFLLYLVFRMPLIGLYASSEQVLELGTRIMLIVAVVSFPEAHGLICAGTLRGAGKTRFVAAYSLISIALVRPILTWVLSFQWGWGLYGAWVALLVDQTTRAVCAAAGVRLIRREGRGFSRWRRMLERL